MSRGLNAVVTGASSGIGKAIAVAIASAGGSVCLVGRNMERLKETAKSCRGSPWPVLVISTDLSTDRGIDDLAHNIEKEFQLADTLVHCAGAHATGGFAETPVSKLDDLYRVNVRMPYVLTQALLPRLKSHRGQIAFVNSSQGLQARAKSSAFAATQHALKAIADSLRQEVNAYGIRVLSVHPGRTASPRMEALFKIEGRPYLPDLLLQPEDVAQVVVNALLMPRTAEVTNIEIRPLTKSY
jgi:short-subunit dehydrogenase